MATDWAKTFLEMAKTPRRVRDPHCLGNMLNPLRTRRDYMAVARPTFLVMEFPEPTDEEVHAWEQKRARERFLAALRHCPVKNDNIWD